MIKNPLFAENSFTAEKHGLLKIILLVCLALLLIALKYFKWDSPEKKLYQAIIENNLHKASELLEKKASVNARVYKGSTLLHDAIVMENPEMVALLLKHKANTQARNRFFQTPRQWAHYILRDTPAKRQILALLEKNTPADHEKLIHPSIGDFIVCNAYWDYFSHTSLQNPYTAKFAVLFYPNSPDLDQIRSLEISGPDNYQFKIHHNQSIDLKTLNGFTLQKNGFRWFQGYDPRGFIKNGRYILNVVYKDGQTASLARDFTYQDKVLKAYLNQKQNIRLKLHGDTKKGKIHGLSWTPLGGVNTYYCNRMAKRGPKEHITRNLTRDPIIFDNIFNQPGRGLNLSQMRFYGPIDLEAGKYLWMMEILDHNYLDQVSLAIFHSFKEFSIDTR